jgi:hypothetical protein
MADDRIAAQTLQAQRNAALHDAVVFHAQLWVERLLKDRLMQLQQPIQRFTILLPSTFSLQVLIQTGSGMKTFSQISQPGPLWRATRNSIRRPTMLPG